MGPVTSIADDCHMNTEVNGCYEQVWLFSWLQFLLIFRRAAAGELQEESGLMALARLSEINVSTEGVMGAKDFFEAKVC